MTDSDATSGPHDTGESGGSQRGRRGRRGRRDIVVPMRLYKTITVFSTLIAVVSVVLGFVFLDAATLQVSALRAVLSNVLSVVGIGVADGLLSTVLAVFGLTIIAFGAVVYTLGTRFRARGMGKSQEDSGEGSNNG
ncbi:MULTISPECIES: hypothetical protein [Haloferax]|uniref:DUF7315 domain-containing protein n=2 Tax=Haloferax TaxID=2251 RepID=A0A6G1Z5R8_9EURY|nr:MULTISPECIES: hypothetical protein [Haloferax]KAB1189084.1 hypothetical protein Hfx1149_13985 [Haloferax sp. CBA1149]MRW81815.1 hypothetical protein [Haloferax marinisediminis]